MREDQEFVWGFDLKKDLSSLDARYSELPLELKELGVLSFATTPPHDGNYLTTQLWDRHMSKKWRDRDEVSGRMPKSNKRLANEINEFNQSEPISPDDVDFDLQSADAMSIQRMVRKQKGKWLQVPTTLKDEGS